jgi:hypothetical protein
MNSVQEKMMMTGNRPSNKNFNNFTKRLGSVNNQIRYMGKSNNKIKRKMN